MNCNNCRDICSGQSCWRVTKERTECYGVPEYLYFADKCQNSGNARKYSNTGIPAIYHEVDYPSFNFKIYQKDMANQKKVYDSFFKQYQKWESQGKGLYLWSKTTGSGKTLLACSLGQSIMIKYDIQLRFITVPDYIAITGESYNRERGTEDKSEVYRTCQLLILDDIGTQKKGEWQEQEIFRLINGRLDKGLVTIFTANMEPEDLNVGSRSINRIIKSSVIMQMPEEPIRKMKAMEERDNFLKTIGL